MPRLRAREEDGVLRPTAAGDGKQKRRKSNWLATRKLCANAKSDLGCVNLPPHLRWRHVANVQTTFRGRDRETPTRARDGGGAAAASAKSHYQGEKDEGLVQVYVASSVAKPAKLYVKVKHI